MRVAMHIRGQALNEQIYQYIIVISGSVGFLYGAYMEDFSYCVRAWFGGCCLACLVRLSVCAELRCYAAARLAWVVVLHRRACCVPAPPLLVALLATVAHTPSRPQICIPEWSFFNRDPEQWLDPAALDAAAAKKSKSKSKKSKDKKSK